MKEGIATLEAELVDDTRAPCIEITSLLIQEKRPTSSRLANQPVA
jgi:hypothetical protein